MRDNRSGARACGIALALGFALVISSCGGSGSSASQRSTSTARSTRGSTPSAADAARERAVATYNAMWQDMAAAAVTADYQSPQLAQHAAGDALSLLVRGLYRNQRMGIVVKGKPITHPTVTDVTPSDDPTTVAVRDCFDATNWLDYKASTGELQDDNPGGRHLTTATVTPMAGDWKVTQFLVGGLGTC